MSWTAAAVSVGVVIVAAVVGNAFVPKDALHWFRQLRWPRWMIPYPVFLVVGVVYYVLMAVVLYRSLARGDLAAFGLAIVVVIGNEAWNAVFFGRRSVRGGYLGMLAFAVPVAVLFAASLDDVVSAVLVACYLAWVLYDVAWSHALWWLNSR